MTKKQAERIICMIAFLANLGLFVLFLIGLFVCIYREAALWKCLGTGVGLFCFAEATKSSFLALATKPEPKRMGRKAYDRANAEIDQLLYGPDPEVREKLKR